VLGDFSSGSFGAQVCTARERTSISADCRSFGGGCLRGTVIGGGSSRFSAAAPVSTVVSDASRRFSVACEQHHDRLRQLAVFVSEPYRARTSAAAARRTSPARHARRAARKRGSGVTISSGGVENVSSGGTDLGGACSRFLERQFRRAGPARTASGRRSGGLQEVLAEGGYGRR